MAPKRETALDAWGKELAHACESAGMTGRQLAEALHVAPSTVSQWMHGRRTPHVEDVERCDGLLATNGYLARYFNRWVAREIPASWTGGWRAAEAQAEVINSFDLSVVPGLLQTEDYARAILRFSQHPAVDFEELTHRRMERQAVIDGENPPLCIFVIDQSALWRMVGDADIMSAQLARLCDLATRPNVVVKVIPSGVEYYAGCPFMLLWLDGTEIVALDDAFRGRVVEDRVVVAAVRKIWEGIREAALTPGDSLNLIKGVMSEWEARSGKDHHAADPMGISVSKLPLLTTSAEAPE